MYLLAIKYEQDYYEFQDGGRQNTAS